MTRLFALDPLTILDAAPPEQVLIAAATGCQYVGLWGYNIVPPLEVPLVTDPAVRRETARRLADTGVKVWNIECFNLVHGADFDAYARALETGAELGARTATAISYENPDPASVPDLYARLVELARGFNIKACIEFFPAGDVRSLPEALAVIAAAGGGALLIDLLHVMRSGCSFDELAKIDPGLLAYFQVNDGPAVSPNIGREAAVQRGIPGEGVFPIKSFIANLPNEEVPVGVEVPLFDLQQQGVSALERVHRIMAGLRRVLGSPETGVPAG